VDALVARGAVVERRLMCPLGSEEIAGLGFEQVVRSAPVAIVVVDASGRVVHSNGRARELTAGLGHEMPADLDRAIDIFHPDGRRYDRREWPAVRSIRSGEEIVDEEFFYALPAGARLWISCSSSPVREKDGEIVAAVLTQTDVTERKDQEERLVYLAGLLDNTEDAIVAFDDEWFVTVWNAGAERLYGWRADEVLGRHTLEVARLEMSQEERAEVRLAAAERGRWRGELIAYRKDGAPVWVELVIVALRGPQGQLTGYLGIHRDVADRKRAEEALRAAQRRSETILESITDKFSAVDREWRYTYINERALAQARSAKGREIAADDVLGVSCWEFLPELVGTTIDRELHRAMREQRLVEFEAYSEASANWLEVRAYPSEDGLSIYAHDVSERKAAQEEVSRRAEQQALVAQLGQRAMASDDLQSLLDDAVGLVAATLDVALAGVAEMAPAGEEIVFRAGVGWREGVVGGRLDEVGRGSLTGYTALVGEPVLVEDLATDPRFTASANARDHGAVSALSVMIESRDEPFGVLSALSTRRRTFSPSDVSFVQSVANVLATAVERSRAEERLGEVRDAERSRIARDLHDQALQALTDALVQADRGRSEGLAPDAAGALGSTLRRVGKQLRAAIYDLRLTDEGRPFAEALRDLVDVQRAAAIDCQIGLDIGPKTPVGVPGGRGTEVLRIVSEALTNARRHSGARHIRVTARDVEESGLCVEVADDGCGFDRAGESPRSGGRGIQGMRERAALVGGDLDIRSAPGAGTEVRIELRRAQRHARPRGTPSGGWTATPARGREA
jgi:PAS domain S-box-containing protein